MATRESIAIRRDNAVSAIITHARTLAEQRGIDALVLPEPLRDPEEYQAAQLEAIAQFLGELSATNVSLAQSIDFGNTPSIDEFLAAAARLVPQDVMDKLTSAVTTSGEPDAPVDTNAPEGDGNEAATVDMDAPAEPRPRRKNSQG